MKKSGYYYCTLLIIFLTSYTMISGQTTTYNGNGKWSSSGNWTAGVPNGSLSAEIPSTATVDVLSDARCLNLLISLGTLNIGSGHKLEVNGDFVNDGGTLTIASGGKMILRGGISNFFGDRHVEIASSIEIASKVEVDETFNIRGAE